MFIPGYWKHAGIMDCDSPKGDSQDILSASKETSSGFAVGWETRTKWSNETRVKALRVTGRTDANGKAAVIYARQFIGRPVTILTSRQANSHWYCSKLVYRAWLSQGKNLEPPPEWYDDWVSPTDLDEDNDTYYIGGDQPPLPVYIQFTPNTVISGTASYNSQTGDVSVTGVNSMSSIRFIISGGIAYKAYVRILLTGNGTGSFITPLVTYNPPVTIAAYWDSGDCTLQGGGHNGGVQGTLLFYRVVE
jgi:hypothetical protein